MSSIVYYYGFSEWLDRTGGVVPGATLDEDAHRRDFERFSGIGWVEWRNANRDAGELMADSGAAFMFGWEWTWFDRQRGEVHPQLVNAAAGLSAVLLALLILGLFPWPRNWRAKQPDDGARPQPWWLGTLWLAAWMVLPMYGFFYCRSSLEFQSPAAWLTIPGELFEQQWLIIAAAMLAVAGTCLIARPARYWMAIFFPLFALVLAAGMLTPVLSPHVPDWPQVPGLGLMLIVTFALAPPMAWYFSGETTRERLIRTSQAALVIATIFIVSFIIFLVWDELRQRAVETGRQWTSVWVPRYLGIIWPALAIGAAALLLRLPTAPLRICAIVLLLGVNLANGLARIALPTEPPIDRVAADVLAAQQPDSPVRTFVHPEHGGPGPADGWLFQFPARYYLSIYSGRTFPPQVIRSQAIHQEFNLRRHMSNDPRIIRRSVRRSPEVTTLILWNRHRWDRAPDFENDVILRALESIEEAYWQRVEVRFYPVHEPWSWRRIAWVSRREYRDQERDGR